MPSTKQFNSIISGSVTDVPLDDTHRSTSTFDSKTFYQLYAESSYTLDSSRFYQKYADMNDFYLALRATSMIDSCQIKRVMEL